MVLQCKFKMILAMIRNESTSLCASTDVPELCFSLLSIPSVVVTISTLANPQPSGGMRLLDARLVSLLPAVLVDCVEQRLSRRRKTKLHLHNKMSNQVRLVCCLLFPRLDDWACKSLSIKNIGEGEEDGLALNEWCIDLDIQMTHELKGYFILSDVLLVTLGKLRLM